MYRLAYVFAEILLLTFALGTCAQDSPASSPQTHPVKAYHDGGIRDLDAIGNRNIGCGRGLGNWYSLDRQIAMGKQYSREVDSTAKFVSDPLITEYINRVGQNLVRNSDSVVPFTIKVVDTDDINASTWIQD
jgi:beta-barrel assembly-enhancing protease